MTMPNPTPMPEIEIGDWVRPTSHLDVAVVEMVARKGRVWHVYLHEHAGYLTGREIAEIRKADGRIWRREEPQR